MWHGVTRAIVLCSLWLPCSFGAELGLAAKSVNELVRDLASEDRKSAEAAMYELGRRGRPALATLTAHIRDPKTKARDQAVICLGLINDPDTVPFLIECLRDEERTVRGRAAYALSQIGGEQARVELVAFLAKCLKDDTFNLTKAAESLKELPDPRALPSLLRIVEEASRGGGTGSRGYPVRYAAQALGKIGDPRASGPIARLLDPAAPYSLSNDYLCLQAILGTKGKEALPSLVSYLGALVRKMEGQPELGPLAGHRAALLMTVGADNRQKSYNYDMYYQTLRCLEALSGQKPKGTTRQEALRFWQGCLAQWERKEGR